MGKHWMDVVDQLTAERDAALGEFAETAEKIVAAIESARAQHARQADQARRSFNNACNEGDKRAQDVYRRASLCQAECEASIRSLKLTVSTILAVAAHQQRIEVGS